jgi:hypothetical protein
MSNHRMIPQRVAYSKKKPSVLTNQSLGFQSPIANIGIEASKMYKRMDPTG